MKSEDDTDRVNNISQLFLSQESAPFKHYFNNKSWKGKIKKGSHEYLNRLLNDYRVSFCVNKPLGLVLS